MEMYQLDGKCGRVYNAAKCFISVQKNEEENMEFELRDSWGPAMRLYRGRIGVAEFRFDDPSNIRGWEAYAKRILSHAVPANLRTR